MSDTTPFTQKQLDVLTAFQNPPPSDDSGLGGTIGRDLLNLPTNAANSLLGNLNALGNMGGSEEGKSKPFQLPNLITPPTLGPDAASSSKIGHVIAGGVLPELAAIMIPYAGIGKLGEAAGLASGASDLLANVGTGMISGSQGGPGEMARQAAVFGALGPISKIENPLLRIGTAGALGTADYAATQEQGASQNQSLGQAAFDVLAGSIPHGRLPDLASLQTEVPTLPINEIIPPNRRAPRLPESSADVSGPTITTPYNRIEPLALEAPQSIQTPFEQKLQISRGVTQRVNELPQGTAPISLDPLDYSTVQGTNSYRNTGQIDPMALARPIFLERAKLPEPNPIIPVEQISNPKQLTLQDLEIKQDFGKSKIASQPEYRRTEGGGIAGDSTDIYRHLLLSGLSGAAGGAAAGYTSNGNEEATFAGIAGGLMAPWVHKALLADAAEHSPIFKILQESGSIAGPAYKLPNGQIIKDATATHHFQLIDKIPNSVNPMQIERGFIDEHGRFLTAHEANAEALLSGQIDKKTFRDNSRTRTLGLQSEQVEPENKFKTPFVSERGSVGSGGSVEKEKVISAALRNNNDHSEVHTGPIHPMIVDEMEAKGISPVEYSHGFLTNKGRFLESQQLKGTKLLPKEFDDEIGPVSEDFNTINSKQPVKLARLKKNSEEKITIEPEVENEIASLQKQTDTPEFKEWFGESVTTDKEGKPIVFYHGSRDNSIGREIDPIAINRTGKPRESGPLGFWTTPDRNYAQNYSFDYKENEPRGNITPVYLRAKKIAGFGGEYLSDKGSVPIKIQNKSLSRQEFIDAVNTFNRYPGEGERWSLKDGRYAKQGMSPGEVYDNWPYKDGPKITSFYNYTRESPVSKGHISNYEDRKKFRDLLIQHGYDGWYQPGNGSGELAILQNGNQVKSAIGNSGKFSKKYDSDITGSTSIHTLLPVVTSAGGAIAGYQENGMEGAVTGAILGFGAGMGAGILMDRLQLSGPNTTVRLAKDTIKSSVKEGLDNALNSPAKDLGGQDVYGRGGILPKFFRAMEHLFNLGLPADLHSTITRARGFASDIIEQGNAALKSAMKFNPPDDIKRKINDFLNGKIFSEEEQGSFLADNGAISVDDFNKLTSTEKEGYSAWTQDVPKGEASEFTRVYVPNSVKDKYLSMQESRFLEQIPEEWKEFASLQITARRSMNDFQKTLRDAIPEGFLKEKIDNTIGRYVPRIYRFFEDNKLKITDDQIHAAAQEFGLTKSSAEINQAIIGRKAKTAEDYFASLQKLEGKTDLTSTARKETLGKFQEVTVAGKKYFASPEVVTSLKKFGNEDFLRNEIHSYLSELKTNRQTFSSQGIDKTLFTEREDMGPAFRDMLGEYTDPVERMAMGLQKMYAPSQAAKLISMVKDMKIDNLPISYSADKWAAANTALKEQLSHTTDPEKIASLQKDLAKLNAYKKLPSDIKFGEYSGLYVHRFLSDHFSNDGRIWDSGLGRSMASFNTFFKTTHVPLNPVSQLRQIFSMPIFALIGKATPSSMKQAFDAYRNILPELKREMIREGIWTADFIRGEVKADVDNIMNGRYDSTIMKKAKQGYEGILEFYRMPDMLTRGGTYLSAKNRIALKLGLSADHPDVIKKAVEWTDRYSMNYDNLNRATRVLRNIPFINPFISFQSEMLRLMKNLATDAGKGDIERLATLGGIVALPELAMKVGEQSLSKQDQEQWEKTKKNLPPYMSQAFLVPLAKLQNGKFKYVSIGPIIPQDNFQESVKAIAKGDTDALKAINPFLSSDNSPLFNLITEGVTGESRQTGLKYRSSSEALGSMISEILPPLSPGGYEWNKLANVNVENLRSGKVENWGDLALRYTTGLSSGVISPDAVVQSQVGKLKSNIANLRDYYLRVVRTTSPDSEKAQAYNSYRDGVAALVQEFADKHKN